jgi:hypothetical protein
MFKIGDKIIMKYVKENKKLHFSNIIKSYHNHIGEIVEILKNFDGTTVTVYVVKDLTDDKNNTMTRIGSKKIYANPIAWRKEELRLYNSNRRIINV